MDLADVKVLVNDDANIGYFIPPPMRPEHIYQYIKNMYAGNGIDLLSWDVGINGSLTYDTEAGSPMFAGRTDYGGLETKILMTNYRGLAASGKDIFQCVVDAGHRCGLGVMPAFRMAFHIPDPSVRSLYQNDFVKDKLAWTIQNTEGSGGYGVTPGRILNYERAEVREYMYGVCCEAIDRYDLDGIELNFIRGHANFEADRARENAPLMTELIERIRNYLISKKPHARMAIRVPMSREWALSLGLDVKEWVRRGVVNILMPSLVHGTEFFREISDYAEVCREYSDSNCRLLPTIQNGYTFEHLCAACDNYYLQGADGISSFNYHYQSQFKEGINSFEWFETFRDPELVSRQQKIYPFVPKTKVSTGGRPLPVWSDSDLIRESFSEKDNGVVREVDFPIAERIRRNGGVIRMKVKQLDEGDGLELWADGESLEIESREFFVRDYMYPYIFGEKGGMSSYQKAPIAELDMWPGWVITAVLPPGRLYKKLQIRITKRSGFNPDITVAEIEAAEGIEVRGV